MAFHFKRRWMVDCTAFSQDWHGYFEG